MNTTKTKILTLSLIGGIALGTVGYFASANPGTINLKDFETIDLTPGKLSPTLVESVLNLGDVPLNASATLKQINFVQDAMKKNDQKNVVKLELSKKEGGGDQVELITHTSDKKGPSNTVKNGGSSFGGTGNKTQHQNSLMLGGRDNKITDNGENTIVGASQNANGNAKNAVILGARESKINKAASDQGGSSIFASNKSTIEADSSTIIAGENVKVGKNGHNSLAIGKNITINHTGSFVFNGKDSPLATTTPYTAVISADNGMIINKESSPADIALTVKGGVKVGNQNSDKTSSMIYENDCLRLKNDGTISVRKGCPNLLPPPPVPEYPECGENAKTYEATDTNWKNNSEAGFCKTGRLVGSKPRFFQEPGCNHCALRGFNYCFEVSFDPNSEACRLGYPPITWRCESSTTPGLTVNCTAKKKVENKNLPSPGKKYACRQIEWKLPANAEWKLERETFTEIDIQQGRQAKECDWKCKSGYHKSLDGKSCVKYLTGRLVSCDESKVPANATAKKENVWVNDGDPVPACKWECKEGFTLHNNACEKLECPAPRITQVKDGKVYFENVDPAIVHTVAVAQAEKIDLLRFGSHGSQHSPRDLPNKSIFSGYVQLKAYCKGGEGISEPFGYVSKIKSCELKIDNVSCEWDKKEKKTKWRMNYTYTGCGGIGVIKGTWDSKFKDNIKVFAGYGFDAKGDSHIINADGSISAKKYLTIPVEFGGPSDWFFKIDNSPIFKINRPTIYNKNKCWDTTPKKRKVDWEGNPFEWEVRAIYEENKTKVGSVLYMQTDSCNNVVADRKWRYATCYRYVDDHGIATGLQDPIVPLNGRWFMDKHHVLQLNPYKTYYTPCEGNQRCSFKIGNQYKIEKAKQFGVGILYDYF